MIAVNTIHTFVLLRDGNLIFWWPSVIKESRERERRRGVGEDYPLSPPHRFRDSFCLFGITNAHHTPVI
jgi:hypothetical protein